MLCPIHRHCDSTWIYTRSKDLQWEVNLNDLSVPVVHLPSRWNDNVRKSSASQGLTFHNEPKMIEACRSPTQGAHVTVASFGSGHGDTELICSKCTADDTSLIAIPLPKPSKLNSRSQNLHTPNPDKNIKIHTTKHCKTSWTAIDCIFQVGLRVPLCGATHVFGAWPYHYRGNTILLGTKKTAKLAPESVEK